MSAPTTLKLIKAAPKVTLHDHLDGGVRPSTLVELAEAIGYQGIPVDFEKKLQAQDKLASRSLDSYLGMFAHTTAVLQQPQALVRITAEAVEDLASDNVVYAELRFAPELHTRGSMSMDEAIEAVLEGATVGVRSCAKAGRTIIVKIIVCAVRTATYSYQAALAALRWRDHGVVGFDIAGSEHGCPPAEHTPAFELIRSAKFHLTIHAGEGFGLPSIDEALTHCGAERLGHGVRIVEDITVDTGTVHYGRLAAYVRDRRIPLEMCPSSNVHTGVVKSLTEHPIGLLEKCGFRVTVNCDNRLMSNTTLTKELFALTKAFKWDLKTIEHVNVNAAKSAFCDHDLRTHIIDELLRERYSSLRTEFGLDSPAK